MTALLRITSVLIAFFMISGCAPELQTLTPAKGKNDKTVLILYKKSDFKEQVIANIESSLSKNGFAVIKDSSKKAGQYRSSDFAAVVFMAEYQMWHTPNSAKKYFERNKDSRNTLFVVTSGNPHVKIKKPFDAVTTASKKDRIQPVSGEITEKLLRIIKK